MSLLRFSVAPRVLLAVTTSGDVVPGGAGVQLDS